MARKELGNSPILPDPELPPDFVWSAQTQLSTQYRPQSVVFSPRLICDQPDTFSDNCTWPNASQPESIYTPAVERRWTSREQPDIHSTAAQWPFSDDESTIHLSSQNGPGRSTSNSFHDDYPLPFLSSRYHDQYEQARRDLDHLSPDSESGSCSSQGQPLSALIIAYRDLYERARSELDNDPPSDQSDSSNGQDPSSSRINDSRQEHQLYAPGDFPEEEDSSGSDSSPEQAPYCDSGYDESFSGDHRPEFIDQAVILHPHQPGNAWHVPVIQNHPTDQRNASVQTSQVDLALTRTAFDCCWAQNAVDLSHHSLKSSSTSKESTVSNGHFTGNCNLRSSKDIVPATQEHSTSPIIISSDSSPDNSVLISLQNGVYSQVNNLSPSGDCTTASSTSDVSTSTSSDSNSVAFFPSPHKACSITSSQRCYFADDMTEMVLSTKMNSGIDGKRAHTEIEGDDEATWDGFPDTVRDDKLLTRMNRVRRSRRNRNEIRIINGINRHIQEPCNKLPLPKRKRSLSPSQMDAKRPRADVHGCQWSHTISGHDLQDVSAESARKERNDCHQTPTSGHDTGSDSDSDGSIQDVQAGPQWPESSVLLSRKRKRPKGETVEEDAVKKSKKEDVAKRPKETTERVFHNMLF